MSLIDQFKALNASIQAAQSQLDNAVKLLELSSEGISNQGVDNKNIQSAQIQIEQLLINAKKGKNVDAEIKAFSKTIKTNFPK